MSWTITNETIKQNKAGQWEYEAVLWGLASHVTSADPIPAIFGYFWREGRRVVYSLYADQNGQPDGDIPAQQSYMWDDIRYIQGD